VVAGNVESPANTDLPSAREVVRDAASGPVDREPDVAPAERAVVRLRDPHARGALLERARRAAAALHDLACRSGDRSALTIQPGGAVDALPGDFLRTAERGAAGGEYHRILDRGPVSLEVPELAVAARTPDDLVAPQVLALEVGEGVRVDAMLGAFDPAAISDGASCVGRHRSEERDAEHDEYSRKQLLHFLAPP
jgi:hypothetical protein